MGYLQSILALKYLEPKITYQSIYVRKEKMIYLQKEGRNMALLCRK